MYPPNVRIFSQLDPVHITTFHLLKIKQNIILPFTPTSQQSHCSRFYQQQILVVQCKSLSSYLCSFLHFPFTSFLLAQSILLDALYLNIRSLDSSQNVNDQDSHPYKITGLIIFVYILNFKFFNNKLETKYSATKYSKHCLTSKCSSFLL